MQAYTSYSFFTGDCLNLCIVSINSSILLSTNSGSAENTLQKQLLASLSISSELQFCIVKLGNNQVVFTMISLIYSILSFFTFGLLALIVYWRCSKVITNFSLERWDLSRTQFLKDSNYSSSWLISFFCSQIGWIM